MIAVNSALILAEAHIQLPVQAVLDAPVTTHRLRELLSRQRTAHDVETGLQAVAALGVDSLRDRHPHPAEIPPRSFGIDRLGGGEDRIGPRLLAAMSLLLSLML